MSLQKELLELREAGVISAETEERIQQYYAKKSDASGSRLLTVFGILGAILVGLGIILIIAHNWDELSRPLKTLFAFMPLLIGQGVGVYVLLKRSEEAVWREGSSVFIFFALAASISLVSQIYNIPGDLSSFMLTWMLLSLPLVYLLRSSVTSLLYLIGITYYAVSLSYWGYPTRPAYLYWLLLLVIIPYYYRLIRRAPNSNYTTFHHWFLPMSLTFCLGTLADQHGELMWVAYMGLFSSFYLIGKVVMTDTSIRSDPYTALGSFGTVGLLLILSFDQPWHEIRQEAWIFSEVLVSPEMIVTFLVMILAGGLLYRYVRSRPLAEVQPMAFAWVVFLLIYIIGLYAPLAVVLVNLLVFAFGLFTLRYGARQEHLGILNYGLLIIAALVMCRFFDERLSFVLRGIMFVLVGIGFFVANYRILKKRKAHAE